MTTALAMSGRNIRNALLVAAIATLSLPASAGAFVYWTNVDFGAGTTIGRANLDGSRANQAFMSTGRFPTGIAVDDQHLYWANQGAGTIGRASLSGTAVNPFFITGVDTPFGVAVDGQHVYWTNGASEIGRANLDGTSPDPSFITGAVSPVGVAVDREHVYWANQGGGTIGRANLDGSTPDQSFITTTTTVVGPNGVAVDGQHIYWTSPTPGEIGRANLNGTGVEVSFIATGDAHPFGVAVDAQHVYWTNLIAGTIGRASLDGASPDPAFITGPSTPAGLAVDSLPYATSTAVACSPAAVTVPASTSCTATVGDTAAAPSAPTGTVAFSSTGGGSFGSPARCSLVATSGAQSTCQITYTPSAAGTATITAAYLGDATNAASNGTASLRVRGPRSGTPPSTKSSNSFRLSRPKLNTRRGTATITARIPGPGRLVLRGEGLENRTKKASGAGRLKLTVKPRHWARHRLDRTGRASVKAKVTYTPRGGDARTKSKRMTLKLRRRR